MVDIDSIAEIHGHNAVDVHALAIGKELALISDVWGCTSVPILSNISSGTILSIFHLSLFGPPLDRCLPLPAPWYYIYAIIHELYDISAIIHTLCI